MVNFVRFKMVVESHNVTMLMKFPIEKENDMEPNIQDFNLGMGQLQTHISVLGKILGLLPRKWNRTSEEFRKDAVHRAINSTNHVVYHLGEAISEFVKVLDWLDNCYDVEEELHLDRDRELVRQQRAEEDALLNWLFSRRPPRPSRSAAPMTAKKGAKSE
jgi:hypothetical protein